MPDTAARQRVLRLLIVEDDASQLYTLTDIMREEGFEVIGCATAAEALEQIEICDFAVAIVDERLPDLSGTGLLEKIRERDSQLRVIIHTGYGSFDSAKTAVNLDAFAYVEKLRDPAELIGHVHRAWRDHLTHYTDALETEIAQRKRVEKILRESEERYRMLVETMSEGLAVQDKNALITYVNERLCKLWGYARDDLIGHRVADFFDAPMRELVDQRWARRTRDDREPYELELRRKDGEKVFVIISPRPMFDADGFFDGSFAVITDIHRQKEVEGALRQSEQRFRQLAENIREVFWMKTPDYRETIYISPAYEEVWGRTCQSLYDDPESFAETIHPDDCERIVAAFEKQARGECNEEYRIVRPDGSVRWVRDRAFPIHNEAGEVYRIAGIAEDVTERKRAERALRLVTEGTSAATGVDFFRSLVRHLASALGARNAMIGEMVDGEAETIRTLASWSDGSYVENVEYDLRGTPCETVVGHEPCYYPSGVQAAFPDDGMLAEMGIESYLGTPLFDSDGGTLGLLVVMHDEPFADAALVMPIMAIFAARAGAELARERAQERVRQREEELAHVGRLSVMGEMATGIAHELNQPLSAIMNFTSACLRMVESGDASSADLRRNLERVSSLTTRSGEIIRRIRNFVRKRRPDRSTVCINSVVREVIDLVSAGGRLAGTELQLDLAEDLPLVRVDSIPIQQVLLNLVSNAIDATHETDADAERVVTVRTEVGDGRWVDVTVRDTGPGLDPEIRNRLFEPYVTTKKEGLGMGLPISRSIIEAHGGRLVVDPDEGGGATFRFRVPRR